VLGDAPGLLGAEDIREEVEHLELRALDLLEGLVDQVPQLLRRPRLFHITTVRPDDWSESVPTGIVSAMTTAEREARSKR